MGLAVNGAGVASATAALIAVRSDFTPVMDWQLKLTARYSDRPCPNLI
jgi:hypothetical protein